MALRTRMDETEQSQSISLQAFALPHGRSLPF
jgi:hypothetical protein